MKFRKQRGGSDRRNSADSPPREPSDEELSAALDRALRRALTILARRHQQTSSSAPAGSIDVIDSENDLIN